MHDETIWVHVPASEHHGDYITVGHKHGDTVCDLYFRTPNGYQAHNNAAEHAPILAAAKELLAYAECEEAAQAPAKTLKEFYSLLFKHGWDGQERVRAFIRKLRRAALSKARGASHG